MKLSDNPVTVMFRAVHAARRKKGLCARCGLAPSAKFWLCKWCRADKNEDQRETYDKNAGILSTKAQTERERRKQLGICINCKNPVAVKVFKAGPRNLIRCPTHTLQHAEDVRNREERKELDSERAHGCTQGST